MLKKILGKIVKETIEMDELKLKLSTRFMRKIVSKLISRSIRKKYGYNIDIHLEDLDIESFDCETTVRASVELKIDNGELIEILQKAELD